MLAKSAKPLLNQTLVHTAPLHPVSLTLRLIALSVGFHNWSVTGKHTFISSTLWKNEIFGLNWRLWVNLENSHLVQPYTFYCCNTGDILTCHRRKNTGVNNKINDGWIPFSCSSFQGHGVVHAGSLSHCNGLFEHWNRTNPSLMLLVTPELFLLWQVKMSAVKNTSWKDLLHNSRE